MVAKLTQSEERCLYMAARYGYTSKEIAKHLHMSEQTVKNHLASARLKLGAKNTAHAIFIYYGATGVTSA